MEKILWICKESFTGFSAYTISDFKEYINEALFIHPTESILNQVTYRNFSKINPGVKIYHLDKVITDFSNQKTIDKSISSMITKYLDKYSDFFGYNELLMSSQIFTTPYHYRFYFRDLNQEEKNVILFLMFKNIEDIILQSKPTYIFDFDNSEIGRSILFLIAKKLSIPYITIEHTRYKGYLIPNFSLGRKNDDYLIYPMTDQDHVSKDSFQELVENFRNQVHIMNKDYVNNKTTKKTNNSLIKDLLRLFRYCFVVLKKSLSILKLNRAYQKSPFFASTSLSILFFIKLFIRERYLLSHRNKIFILPKSDEEYIYFPLHLIPESSTLIKCPNFPNEEIIIKRISMLLPPNMKIFIKEHGAMIGERPLKFYKELNRIHNVQFIRLDAFDDPKEWILRSKGVITISGTTAFEAAMLGVPSIILGNVPFEHIKGVFRATDLHELKANLQEVLKLSIPIDNKSSNSKYLEVIAEYGEKVDFTRVHNLFYESLLKGKQLSQIKSIYLKDNLHRLSNVFRKGIEIDKKNKIV